MTPLEQIEQGLLTGDLNIVAEGYKSLTGKNPLEFRDPLIKTTKKRGRKPKSTPQVDDVDPFAEFRTPIPENIAGGKEGRCRAAPFVLPKENEFKDDKKLHKEDIKLDKKLTKGVSRSARRPEVNMVNLKCVKCKEGFEVQEQFALRFADPDNSEDTRPQFLCEKCF